MAKTEPETPPAIPKDSAFLKCEYCGNAERVSLERCKKCNSPQRNWYEDRIQQLEKQVAADDKTIRAQADTLNGYSSDGTNLQDTIIHLERKLRDSEVLRGNVEKLEERIGAQRNVTTGLRKECDLYKKERDRLHQKNVRLHNEAWEKTENDGAEEQRLRELLCRVIDVVGVAGFDGAVKWLEENLADLREAKKMYDAVCTHIRRLETEDDVKSSIIKAQYSKIAELEKDGAGAVVDDDLRIRLHKHHSELKGALYLIQDISQELHEKLKPVASEDVIADIHNIGTNAQQRREALERFEKELKRV